MVCCKIPILRCLVNISEIIPQSFLSSSIVMKVCCEWCVLFLFAEVVKALSMKTDPAKPNTEAPHPQSFQASFHKIGTTPTSPQGIKVVYLLVLCHVIGM